MLFKVATSVQS